MPRRAWVISYDNNDVVITRWDYGGGVNIAVLTYRDFIVARAASASVPIRELVSTIAEILEENPESLLVGRKHGCDDHGCGSVDVPDNALIAKLVKALVKVLALAPSEEIRDGDRVVWSQAEAEGSEIAKELLDLAASLLEEPEIATLLPDDMRELSRRSRGNDKEKSSS